MKTCSEQRLRGLGAVANQPVVVRHLAPAEERLTLLVDDAREELSDQRRDLARSRGRKTSPAPYTPAGGQRERHHLAQKRVGHLHEDARAVARVGFASAGAAVLEVDEHLHRLADNGVGAMALHVHHEANAAGVVLGARVVQTLSRRADSGPSRAASREDRDVHGVVSDSTWSDTYTITRTISKIQCSWLFNLISDMDLTALLQPGVAARAVQWAAHRVQPAHPLHSANPLKNGQFRWIAPPKMGGSTDPRAAARGDKRQEKPRCTRR